MTNEEALLIDIKFQLDMYGSGQGSAEDTLSRVREIIFSPSLTDDQREVLESLKHYYSKSNYYDIRAGKEPMQAVDRVLMEAESDTTGLSDVYYRLTEKQQFQVLAAFAEWGLSTLDN